MTARDWLFVDIATLAERIVERVAGEAGITVETLIGPSHRRPLVRRRWIAMELLTGTAKLSLSETGRILGGRDHKTVFHGLDALPHALARDPELAALRRRVREGLGL